MRILKRHVRAIGSSASRRQQIPAKGRAKLQNGVSESPAPLASEAIHGVAGESVHLIRPETEADDDAWAQPDVSRKLAPSESHKAEIAKRIITLTTEIKAIRGSGDHPLFTQEDLKWWKDNRPSFLIFNLGLSSDEIIGHITAKETRSKWAAVAIVAGLTHRTSSRGLKPDTVDDYSRRYRKLIKYLWMILAYTVLHSSFHSFPYQGFISHADNAAMQLNEHEIKAIEDWARTQQIPISESVELQMDQATGSDPKRKGHNGGR